MDTLKQQLIEIFGTDGWIELESSDRIEEGDYYNGVLGVTISSAYGNLVDNWTTYYRAKPKQSEKFWVVLQVGYSTFEYETHLLAKDKACELAAEFGCDIVVFEAVGIARAPKAGEYEEL